MISVGIHAAFPTPQAVSTTLHQPPKYFMRKRDLLAGDMVKYQQHVNALYNR
jgi:sulfur transfer complex TusBCD TusB component (DsrH family)